MAENYKVEVDVDIDGVDDAEEKFLALGKSIDKAKQELDEMRDANQQGSKAFKQQKKDLEEMENSFRELNKELKGVDASFEDVYGEVKPLTAALGEAEDRLYQLALAGDKTSQEYQELLQKVSAYRRVQMDTDMAVDAAAGTISEKLGGALQGAASGFAAVQGVMALTGSESEELEETLIKLNAAMAIAQGVSGLREGAKAFTALGLKAKTALTGIRAGLAATGIGLFVVALGAVVAYWDDISAAVSGANEEFDKFKETTDEVNKEFIDLNAEIAQMENTFELAKKGTISHEEALRQYNEQFGETIGYAKDLETAEQNFVTRTALYIEASKARALADAFYKKNAEKLVEAQEELQTTQLSGFHAFTTDLLHAVNLGEHTAAEIEQMAKNQASRRATEQAYTYEQEADSYNERAILLQHQLDKMVKTENARYKKSQSNARKHKREMMDIENDIIDVEFANLEKLYGDTLDNALIRLDHKYTRELEKYDKMLEDQRISEEQHGEMIEALKEKNLQDIQLLREQYLPKQMKLREIEVNMEQEKADQTVSIYGLMYGALGTMAKKNADDQKKLDKEVMAARLQIAHAGLGAIGDLVNSLAADNEKSAKRAFNVNKAVGIAQAVISTAEGIMKAFAQTTDFTPTQSMRIANAAVVAVAGAAQIATIAKQKFQPSGGGSGSGQIQAPSGGTGSASAPSFNVVGDSGISQLAGLQMQPTQAYVVSGDITTAQSLDRNKIENATI